MGVKMGVKSKIKIVSGMLRLGEQNGRNAVFSGKMKQPVGELPAVSRGV